MRTAEVDDEQSALERFRLPTGKVIGDATSDDLTQASLIHEKAEEWAQRLHAKLTSLLGKPITGLMYAEYLILWHEACKHLKALGAADEFIHEQFPLMKMREVYEYC